MVTDDIFDKVEQLLECDDVDIAIYDGEFLDPKKVAELAKRYSTKDGYLIDIEAIEVLGMDSTTNYPNCMLTVVAYAIHSNKRTVGDKVKGSVSRAVLGAKSLSGQKVEAGTDHGEGVFTFLEIQKEDHIPFVSVHALRVQIDMVLALTN